MTTTRTSWLARLTAIATLLALAACGSDTAATTAESEVSAEPSTSASASYDTDPEPKTETDPEPEITMPEIDPEKSVTLKPAKKAINSIKLVSEDGIVLCARGYKTIPVQVQDDQVVVGDTVFETTYGDLGFQIMSAGDLASFESVIVNDKSYADITKVIAGSPDETILYLKYENWGTSIDSLVFCEAN